MIRCKVLLYTFLITIAAAPHTQAAPGCMDNSYHADPCAPIDCKRYRDVKCDCKCERYDHMYSRGKCGGCHHYRVPRDPKLEVRSGKDMPKKCVGSFNKKAKK